MGRSWPGESELRRNVPGRRNRECSVAGTVEELRMMAARPAREGPGEGGGWGNPYTSNRCLALSLGVAGSDSRVLLAGECRGLICWKDCSGCWCEGLERVPQDGDFVATVSLMTSASL